MKHEIRGNCLTPDGRVKRGIIVIEGDEIVRCEFEADAPHWEDEGVIVPGFIDVHVHGGGGSDVMDASPEALAAIARTHGAKGTTGWLATTVTHDEEAAVQAIEAAARYMTSERNGRDGARMLGIHLEGPYLNAKRRGVHREEALRRPDRAQFIRWCELADGAVKMITLAPELPGAEEVIREAVRRGVVVSAGHSDATAAEMARAASLGVTHATHLFNAMRPLHHREPGLIGHVLRDPDMTADLIVDGVHLHADIVELALRCKGTDKLLLITDAMRAACMGDGTYDIGGLSVTVASGAARTADGTLAGSLLTLNEAFRRLLSTHGLPLADASRMASLNPAALLRLDHERGIIAEGMKADLVLLHANGDVGWTMAEGRYIFRS